ncbi:DUF6233 domain-containing protein [Streptomyces sp. NPDC058459]|uniref:DUF6233 domain-containing protein n=1 Tax=Streptomyces sp. NPDC058459 TaxID=3346508 RepID=UPI003656B0DD
MYDLPPDLPRLRTLRIFFSRVLAQVDAAIADAERQEAEQQRGQQARPPAPDWILQLGVNPANVEALHTGDCPAPRKSRRTRGITREQAVDALREQVRACPLCRPDTALGVLG